MGKYILKRVLLMFFVLFCIVTICFMLIRMLPRELPTDKNLQAVILCPTRELAIQAAEEMRRFAKYMHGIKILPVYGGQEIYKQIKNLKCGVQIVVGTPGRVMDHMRRKTLKMQDVKIVVLDEADDLNE